MFDFFKKKPYFIGKEGSKITLKQFGYMTVEIGHAESLNTINNFASFQQARPFLGSQEVDNAIFTNNFTVATLFNVFFCAVFTYRASRFKNYDASMFKEIDKGFRDGLACLRSGSGQGLTKELIDMYDIIYKNTIIDLTLEFDTNKKIEDSIIVYNFYKNLMLVIGKYNNELEYLEWKRKIEDDPFIRTYLTTILLAYIKSSFDTIVGLKFI